MYPLGEFFMLLKLLFHKHLESVTTQSLWRWAKGIAIVGAAIWAIPDCIPFIDEITVTWLAVSVLWELNARGELKSPWIPENIRKRLSGPRQVDTDRG
ncbi:hypothetical protein EBS80_01840 [bacterium]|nr:hypothetical protein [bacterium]